MVEPIPPDRLVLPRQIEIEQSCRSKILRKPDVPVICVVDDDVSVVEGLVSLLESVGYTAVGFGSAEEFLNSSQLGHTACLILDVLMPGMGGLELQRRLLAAADPTPIIFVTAHGGSEIAAETSRLGAAAFLAKPFSQESLLEAVRSAVTKRVRA